MESAPSNNLFFSIKALNSDSNGVIPFVVRTHWGYTRWSKISFYYLAEASDLVNAGYYQVDPATLSACTSGKQIIAYIPTECRGNDWKALTFLNGFEISSVNPNGNFNTPYDLQLTVKGVSSSGVTVLVSTTSATQVHALFVSYIVYDPSINGVLGQNVVYDDYVGTKTHQFVTPAASDASLHLLFWGVNSFIISNTGSTFGLSIAPNAQGIQSMAASNFFYLSYGVFGLSGGKCGQCSSYSIFYNGQCVASCPPSSYYNGVTCVTCTSAQVWNGTACVARPVVVPPTTPTPTTPTGPIITCPRGTWWDNQQLRCLPCPAGCSSCPDCYSCDSCSLGFFKPAGKPLCEEVCGDGMKFILGCDDGNKINGDGCSSTCEVETGYTCNGGSPSSKDTCSRGMPSALDISSTGQSRVWGKVIVNVRLNYLPQALIDSATDCKNSCNNVLAVNIISGDSSATSIVARYIPTTTFSFSIEVDFGKEPVGMFVLNVGLRPSIAAKYFGAMDTSKQLTVNVNPAYFSAVGTNDIL